MTARVKIGKGVSYSQDPIQAAKEAVSLAIKQISIKPNFGFVFCSERFEKNDKALNALVKSAHRAFRAVNSKCEWIGCTVADLEGSCLALAMYSDSIQTAVGVGFSAARHSTRAAEKALEETFSKIDIDSSIERYVANLAEKKRRPQKLNELQPYSVLLFTPNLNKSTIAKIANLTSPYIPVLGGTGRPFANGVVPRDSLILMLNAFEQENKLCEIKHQLLASLFKTRYEVSCPKNSCEFSVV